MVSGIICETALLDGKSAEMQLDPYYGHGPHGPRLDSTLTNRTPASETNLGPPSWSHETGPI